MDIKTDVYRAATYEEIEAYNCDECYSLLIGPNGFECLLTEPEDRNWHRDGRHVVAELNRLLDFVKKVATHDSHVPGILRGEAENIAGLTMP